MATLLTAVAASGLVAHNLLSLRLPPYALETIGPLAIYAALLAWLRLSRGAAAPRGALFAWAGLNLVGGGVLSVLPLPFLPFEPEQTATHYLAHAVYALTQLPLLAALARPEDALA